MTDPHFLVSWRTPGQLTTGRLTETYAAPSEGPAALAHYEHLTADYSEATEARLELVTILREQSETGAP